MVPARHLLWDHPEEHALRRAGHGPGRRGPAPHFHSLGQGGPDGIGILDDLAEAADHHAAQLAVGVARLDHQCDPGVAPDVQNLLGLAVGRHAVGVVRDEEVHCHDVGEAVGSVRGERALRVLAQEGGLLVRSQRDVRAWAHGGSLLGAWALDTRERATSERNIVSPGRAIDKHGRPTMTEPTTKTGGMLTTTVDRRRFLKSAGLATVAATGVTAAGLEGILAAKRAPAYAQGTRLNIVRWVDFIPACDV